MSEPTKTNDGASATTATTHLPPVSNGIHENERDPVVEHISAAKELRTTVDTNGTKVSVSVAEVVAAAAIESDTLNKGDIGVGEHNKPADALQQTTPIDNNNNNSSDLVRKKKAEVLEEEEAGETGEATFTNNTVAEEEVETSTRRRPQRIAEKGEIEGEPLNKDTTEDKAVQCNGSTGDPTLMLQDWQEMPRYLQFNPYIHTGYRPLQNVSECFGSLFYLHNETFNILTHGIPIVYILATVPSKLMWDDYRFLSWCHIVGSVAPWCGSFLYHLFMNVNRGEKVYYTLLKLDMLGIWISQSFGALPMVTATVHCLNWPLKWLFIYLYSLLSIWGLYKAMCASSPWQRRLCFFLPFTMRVLLTMIRLTRFGGGNTTSMTHIFLQDAVSVAGGAIGAMHIPEKWFPGCMDYYLNSHNIMHVLVVLAVYSMHQATVQDLDWMSKAECLMGATISLQEASITASSNADL